MPEVERVMVYIDGSNLYRSLQNSFGRTNLDYSKFSEKLAGNRRLVRIYHYGVRIDQTKQPDQYKAQQSFFDALGKLRRFELRFGRLVYDNLSNLPLYEKGVDIKLATDMLLHASRNNYDVAILVSGDTDFVDMVQAVKDLGKNVEVALFNPSGSRSIREVADVIIEVDSTLLEDCWLP